MFCVQLLQSIIGAMHYVLVDVDGAGDTPELK